MIGQSDVRTPTPSLAALGKTTLVAAAVAALLLAAFVLPAEYGIDPLGTGRRLGLTAIASPPDEPVQPIANPEAASLAPTQRGPVGDYPRPFKLDTYEIALGPRESIEYKYRLEKGATMLYAWTATAPVAFDFHGEGTGLLTDGAPSSQSYEKQNGSRATGSFAAPFTGIHGWYWENAGTEPVTVRVTSAGFYSNAVEIRSNGTRKTRDVRSLDDLHPQRASK
jgi:hypothetical protein